MKTPPNQAIGAIAEEDPGEALSREEWHPALTQLARDLHRPMSLSETERIEDVVKTYLRRIFRSDLSGHDARFLARWQRDLGFLLKYKSYGVKCATPFGYSVFLQNPGEGFSFQRHLTHKTEIFHILEPLEGALVFLCRSEEWDGLYERERFQRWLDGRPDEGLDCFATRPQPGDVYHVSELGVIHSVLGCVLEEFATVSTDMVDRLHDQNTGRTAPHVERETVVARLRSLTACAPRVAPTDAEAVDAIVHDGDVQSYSLARGAIDASHLHLTRARVELQPHPSRVRIVFVVAGSASCVIRGSGDAADATPPAIEIRGGDPLLIAPGAHVTITAGDRAVLSIQGIEPEVALV